jgi:hypothetical protein
MEVALRRAETVTLCFRYLKGLCPPMASALPLQNLHRLFGMCRRPTTLGIIESFFPCVLTISPIRAQLEGRLSVPNGHSAPVITPRGRSRELFKGRSAGPNITGPTKGREDSRRRSLRVRSGSRLLLRPFDILQPALAGRAANGPAYAPSGKMRSMNGNSRLARRSKWKAPSRS